MVMLATLIPTPIEHWPIKIINNVGAIPIIMGPAIEKIVET